MNSNTVLEILVQGRSLSSVSSARSYLAHEDWANYYEVAVADYVYRDMFNGNNPYNGVEELSLKSIEKEDVFWRSYYQGWVEKIDIKVSEAYTIFKMFRKQYMLEYVSMGQLNATIKTDAGVAIFTFEGSLHDFTWIEEFYQNAELVVKHYASGGFLEI